jgi:hypothetical protein
MVGLDVSKKSDKVIVVPNAVAELPFIAMTSLPSMLPPSKPMYRREFHAVVPSPTLNFNVSVSKPGSPFASVGLVVAHSKAVPFLYCMSESLDIFPPCFLNLNLFICSRCFYLMFFCHLRMSADKKRKKDSNTILVLVQVIFKRFNEYGQKDFKKND